MTATLPSDEAIRTTPIRDSAAARPRRRLFRSGWPLSALLVFYPVAWILGLTPFIVILLAVPMGVTLLRRRPIKLPPAMGLWSLGVLWAALGLFMIRQHPPDTLPPSSGSSLSFFIRLANYVALTVVLLYVGNMSEDELPRKRIVRMLGAFFLVTIAGGLAGMVAPHLSFNTPTYYLVPHSISSSSFGGKLLSVQLAQNQDVLGSGSAPRPSAPFDYTNTWGNVLSLLLVWFAVAWWIDGTRRRRTLAVGTLVVALVPVVYSLNRGLWVGLALTLLYVLIRTAMRGRILPLVTVLLTLAVAAAIFFVSPLSTVVTARLQHGHSNDIRTSLNNAALDAAKHSPVIGYGGPRTTIGSEKSIAIGSSTSCPQCGNRDIGSDGQLWFLLVSEGFIGALLYVAWLLQLIWTYRRDESAIGLAGQLSLLLPLFFMFVYQALTVPLLLTMVSVGLLWRNEQARRQVHPERT